MRNKTPPTSEPVASDPPPVDAQPEEEEEEASPLPAPALDSTALRYSYEIGRGEKGVLTFEPYKGLLLPRWAFRTPAVARGSSRALWAAFRSYVARGDFVGADMARKFVQMGMTRARRYANHKGGRKYANRDTGETLGRWVGGTAEEVRKREEKEEASEIFKGVWRRCIEDEEYKALKGGWIREKKQYIKANG